MSTSLDAGLTRSHNYCLVGEYLLRGATPEPGKKLESEI